MPLSGETCRRIAFRGMDVGGVPQSDKARYLKNHRIKLLCEFLFSLLAILPTQGRAGMILHFSRFTDNAPTNVASQLSAEVTYDDSAVSFRFLNEGDTSSVITRVYFQDLTGSLGSAAMTEHFVDFTANPTTSPSALMEPPGAQPWWTPAWAAIADRPLPYNGIHNYLGSGDQDWLTITFDSTDFSEVLHDLKTGDLRIALHVQGIPVGTTTMSDSFVNHSPLPASVLLAVFAVGMAGWKLRQFV